MGDINISLLTELDLFHFQVRSINISPLRG